MASVTIMTMSIATDASFCSAVDLGGGEFSTFMIQFPTTNPLTAAGDIYAAASPTMTGTYGKVAYSNSPSTATSTLVPWTASRTSWGYSVLCEAALFARYFRLEFGTAATTASEFYIHLGKDK
jgi:hypothetical protein